MALYRGLIQIPIGTWNERMLSGFDPMPEAHDVLIEQMRVPQGTEPFVEFRWSACVIDFGGQRVLPFDPEKDERIAPFGTVLVQCAGQLRTKDL